MLVDGFWQDIVEVTSGRGQLRLIVQPLMAVLVGVKLGVGDARAGKQPFLWRLATASQRKQLLAQAFKSVLVPFTIAVVVDGFLQYLTHGYVRPVAALVMGAVLVFAPFLLARSLSNRVYRRTHVAALGQ